ncbi:hypothetical protein ACFVGV_17715 [Pseudarthrobacter scleromae]|uniref:hypothetical protein n=1 Tax=Pseudarthrobacter scleromae TaxID=158897 RepID=UPI003641485C
MKHKLWLVFSLILVLAATAFFVVRSAEDKVSDRMLSQADRLAIPGDWKLTRETVRPERFMCISTNPCPSLHRTWETGKELTEDDITAVFSGVRFRMKADRPCERRSNVIGKSPICASRGSDGEFEYLFTVWSPGPGEPQLVVLNVEPDYVPD